MAEEYEYFSDEEGAKSPDSKQHNGEDDEQQQQKTNGRVQHLEAQISRLKGDVTRLHHELDHAKKQHHYKKDVHAHHTNDSLPPNDPLLLHDHDTLTHEIVKLKQIIKEQQAKLDTPPDPGVPLRLTEAFVKIVNQFNFPIEVNHKEHHTVDNFVACLKHVTKQMMGLLKKVDDAPVHGTDSELATKVRNLQDELRLALGAAEDIRALKGKLTQVIERVRLEKEGKLRADQEAQNFRKKTEMLGDHMEKLMAHLRHESATKLRLVKQLQEQEELNRELKQNYSVLLKKNATKDRFILEMHEGSKVLEDQLKLMDEKYLNLRTKLDYARDYGAKKLARSEKTCQELRSKFSLITGSNTLLDSVRTPGTRGSFDSTDFDSMSQNSSVSFDLRSQGTQGSTASGKSRGKRTSSGGKLKPLKPRSAADEEDQLQNVLARIEKKANGGKRVWTEDTMKDLVKSR